MADATPEIGRGASAGPAACRRLLPEMTYTATGFSNPVRVIFDAVFRPTTVEDTRETVAEHFRTAIRREKERVHPVDKLVFHPVRTAAMGFAGWLARDAPRQIQRLCRLRVAGAAGRADRVFVPNPVKTC